jgi:hypothetical protein
MPNPLTDDLTPEAKQELAAVFADMRRRYPNQPEHRGTPAWVNAYDRPHTRRRR